MGKEQENQLPAFKLLAIVVLLFNFFVVLRIRTIQRGFYKKFYTTNLPLHAIVFLKRLRCCQTFKTNWFLHGPLVH